MFVSSREFRHSPNAIIFDGEVVCVHLDSEVAQLAPIGAPAVPAHPVLPAGGLTTPAHNRNDVIDAMGAALAVNPSTVVFKLVCHRNTTSCECGQHDYILAGNCGNP